MKWRERRMREPIFTREGAHSPKNATVDHRWLQHFQEPDRLHILPGESGLGRHPRHADHRSMLAIAGLARHDLPPDPRSTGEKASALRKMATIFGLLTAIFA